MDESRASKSRGPEQKVGVYESKKGLSMTTIVVAVIAAIVILLLIWWLMTGETPTT